MATSDKMAESHFPPVSHHVVDHGIRRGPPLIRFRGRSQQAVRHVLVAGLRVHPEKGILAGRVRRPVPGLPHRVIDHGTLGEARRERGKFRSFLLASVTHFVANEWDRSRAQKRGGDCATLSFDFEAGEESYHREPYHQLTPEALYERQWAMALLDRVLGRQGEEHARRGQAAQFDLLKVFLTGDQDRGSTHELTAKLDMSDAATRTAVHRLRRRYAELLREEIAVTVAGPEEVDGEIRFLLAALERL